MRYISTRGGIAPVSFTESVMMGLASDGGLLLPENIPHVGDKLASWRRLEYQDLAFEIMKLYVDLPDNVLRGLVASGCGAFSRAEVTPVVPLGNRFVLELFHGPTLSFKDVALQFLGGLFEHVLVESDRKLNIVAATSGDTGSAAIHGVKGRERMSIFVMYPRGRISEAQERQMTCVLDPNVHNFAVEGTFDDCQCILKELFNDRAFKDEYSLGAVNSINWARVLAQIVYYFYAAFRVMDATSTRGVRFTVPTGNFGDVFAGYVAKMMGLPIRRLILATNDNDILARYFATGIYSTGKVHATLSPSMDIQVASNFERYLYYSAGEDPARVRELMATFARDGRLVFDEGKTRAEADGFAAGSADKTATLATIREIYDRYGYLVDPHTAVGLHVATAHEAAGEPMICLSTAHPAKFSRAVEEAIGKDIARHSVLDGLSGLPTRFEVVPAKTEDVRNRIVGHLQK